MAQRYGGKYSPDGSSSDRTETPTPKGFKGATVDPVGARSVLASSKKAESLYKYFIGNSMNFT